MALIQADRVKETSSTTGTGNFTLAGATTGFRRFNDGVGSANTCYYVITDNTDYEIGLGTLSNSATLARTTVITSSNSNSAVDWGAGTKDVFTTYPGTKSVIQDANGEVSLGSALGVFGAVSVGGTLAVTGDTDVANLSASGTFDVAGETNLVTATITGTVNVTGDTTLDNVTASGTLNVAGETNLATATITGNVSADGTLNISGNGSVGGTFNVEGDLKNTSGNLTVDPATQIFEIKGSGSTEGQIQLNCAVNTHGQIITAADHGVSATNTLTLPGGDTIGNANATLVSDTGTQTISNKTFDDVTLGTGTADISTMVSQVAFQNNLRERTSINTTSATGTINFDILSHNVELRTNDAAANFELNFRGNASTAFSATVAVGQTTSFAFESSMGSTAYYLTAIKIDGATASPVHWQGGTTAPSEGNAAGIDSYLINITRGADGGSGTAQYTCLASQTQFGKVTY
tara:strand:- start:3787 stop:5175 length:1389 start_codon:yes stop_codon:yes gene_type:complete